MPWINCPICGDHCKTSHCVYCQNGPEGQEPGGHHAADCPLYRSCFVGPQSEYWDKRFRDRVGWS